MHTLNINDNAKDKNTLYLLHYFAKNKELDILFFYICKGYSQKILDEDNKLFIHYLLDWEYKYIYKLYQYWRSGKIWINTYKNDYSSYVPFGFSTTGVPMIAILWENKISLESFYNILDSGIDLQLSNINENDIAVEYKIALLEYGWIPKIITSTHEQYINQIYPQNIWTETLLKETFTIKPVDYSHTNLFHSKMVCIADTHWYHHKIQIPVIGNFLICAGDLCLPWNKDLTDYLLWMGKHQQKYKLLVCGNHDKLFQNNKEYYLKICKEQNIIYLEDSGIEIEGINFWGSPWTPKRPKNNNNAFTCNRKDLISKWNLIPSNINVLITHCPPYGIGDCNTEYYKGLSYQSGDYALRKTINRLQKLKLHVFGHQHYGRGMYKSSNNVYFINAAMVENIRPFII